MDKEKQPQWLRVCDAAQALNVSESTIRRCLANKELEGIKILGTVRVDRDSLIRLTRRRRYADLVRRAGGSSLNWRFLWHRRRAGAR